MGKIKLFPTTEYSSKQSSDPVVPLVPCTGIFLGPSKSGKTVALISLILEQYRGVFERIYVFSPSVNIDDGWIPVKKYIEGDLGVNTEREQTYWDEWDEAALRRIIQQKLEMKKLYQVLVVIDDFADTHKPHGALDTLFIRGRHMQISTWVSSQKLRLISAAVRVNMQFLCCWRLRNQHAAPANVPATSPAVGASAAAPSARPPRYPKAPPTPSAATATSPSSAATAAVSSTASAPRSTSCARCPASSRRRSTSLGRPMICGGGCGCGPGRGNTFRRTYSAASWGSWERKACTAASPAAPAPTKPALRLQRCADGP